MLYSLGQHVFSSLDGTGLNQISNTINSGWREQKIIGGAMSIDDGQPLQKMTLNAMWLSENAEEFVMNLGSLVDGFHQMSDQQGRNLGVWTVNSIQRTGTDVYGSGLRCQTVTISLTEYR